MFLFVLRAFVSFSSLSSPSSLSSLPFVPCIHTHTCQMVLRETAVSAPHLRGGRTAMLQARPARDIADHPATTSADLQRRWRTSIVGSRHTRYGGIAHGPIAPPIPDAPGEPTKGSRCTCANSISQHGSQDSQKAIDVRLGDAAGIHIQAEYLRPLVNSAKRSRAITAT